MNMAGVFVITAPLLITNIMEGRIKYHNVQDMCPHSKVTWFIWIIPAAVNTFPMMNKYILKHVSIVPQQRADH